MDILSGTKAFVFSPSNQRQKTCSPAIKRAGFFCINNFCEKEIEPYEMQYQIKTRHERLLADTSTPVAIYLRLRDIYPNSLLLESSEYHSRDNNISYICCDPIAGITLDRDFLEVHFPDGERN